MQHYIGPQIKRILQVRGRKRVVDYQPGISCLLIVPLGGSPLGGSPLSDGGNIDQAQQWIGRRFDPDLPGTFGERGFEVGRVVQR